jgi:hypothetical protein
MRRGSRESSPVGRRPARNACPPSVRNQAEASHHMELYEAHIDRPVEPRFKLEFKRQV